METQSTNLKPVLRVEDDENDVFFLQRAFKQAEVPNPLVIVPDGQAAIDYCAGIGLYANREKYPLPCLVLLDLNMPRKSGIEVLVRIRSEPMTSILPVIILTSSLQDTDIHRAYGHGASAYLGKPSKPEGLVTMMKSIRDFWLKQNRMVDRTDEESGSS